MVDLGNQVSNLNNTLSERDELNNFKNCAYIESKFIFWVYAKPNWRSSPLWTNLEQNPEVKYSAKHTDSVKVVINLPDIGLDTIPETIEITNFSIKLGTEQIDNIAPVTLAVNDNNQAIYVYDFSNIKADDTYEFEIEFDFPFQVRHAQFITKENDSEEETNSGQAEDNNDPMFEIDIYSTDATETIILSKYLRLKGN